MDVTIIANDTRGGVEPYLALGLEAAKRGHEVRAAAPDDYATAFAQAGIRFIPLSGVDREAISAHADRSSLREMGRHVADLVPVWARDVRDAAEGTDLLVAGIGGMGLARPVAAALGVPLLRAHLQPLDAPSGEYPGPLSPRLDRLGALGRRLSHVVTQVGTTALLVGPERVARRAVGVGTTPTVMLPSIVYGFSPAVVPVNSNRATRRIATGWWTLPHEAAVDISPDLGAFLEESSEVVSIGFGSMLGPEPERLFDVVAQAVTAVGVRAVVLTGWGGLAGTAPRPDVRAVTAVPHGWLFPRVAATVHHGGAGTTGAALRAGVPTFIAPFGADQPFWGSRTHRLGVSPAPVPQSRLTVEVLSRSLERMLRDSVMRERAAALGETLRREPGAAGAVDHLESVVAG
ncbi:glycosyltransferase [Microbacterium sp. SLBN-154]|uniref:glycosyltransferase n=1 Tax=Microbacterium sp. SLBN-154 TaxID=2768458 RepID=UPI00114F1B57|nr:glycosyltransferase [Microbacterium sp. SLBN-154]